MSKNKKQKLVPVVEAPVEIVGAPAVVEEQCVVDVLKEEEAPLLLNEEFAVNVLERQFQSYKKGNREADLVASDSLKLVAKLKKNIAFIEKALLKK